MADFTPEEDGQLPGEAAVFWIWMTLIVGGLVVMITIPLMGR